MYVNACVTAGFGIQAPGQISTLRGAERSGPVGMELDTTTLRPFYEKQK